MLKTPAHGQPNQSFAILRPLNKIHTDHSVFQGVLNISEKVKSESLECEDMIPPKYWPLQGAIRMSGVSASYGYACWLLSLIRTET
jgi:hypothetical protein